jgi:hypothetical protein
MTVRPFRLFLSVAALAGLISLLAFWPDGRPPAASEPLAQTDPLEPERPAWAMLFAAADGAPKVAAVERGGEFAALPMGSLEQRFPKVEVLETLAMEDGATWRSLRTVRVDDPFPLLRLEERWERDETGGWAISSREVMLADHLQIEIVDRAREDSLIADFAALGIQVARRTTFSPVWQLRLPEMDALAVPRYLAALAEIAAGRFTAEPDFVRFAQNTPNDYNSISQWGHERVEAPAAWTVSTGSSQVVVAVIDSGIDVTHPDLAANLWRNPGETAGNGRDDDGNGFVDDVHGYDFVDGTGQLKDNDGHGTHIAGIIGAVGNNGQGTVGVNWTVRLMGLRVGDKTFPTSLLAQALDYASAMRRDFNVPVVATNNSYGSEGFSSSGRSAIIRSRDAGILFVAAAGNEKANNDVTPHYPSSYTVENVIAVASISQADRLSSFSNYGVTSVHIAAPGTGIRSTVPGGMYEYRGGTSMATPYVAGAVALLRSAQPSLSWQQTRLKILNSADALPSLQNRVAGSRRLNLRRMMDVPAAPTVAMELPIPPVLAGVPGTSFKFRAAATVNGAPFVGARQWTREFGPGPVTFDTPEASETWATFPEPGIYRIRFSAGTGPTRSHVERVVVIGQGPGLNAGLQAYWTFEGGGEMVADLSGNGRDGRLTGGATRAEGRIEQGVTFPGDTAAMRFSSSPQERISITAWARMNSGGPSIFPRIVHTPDYILYFGREASGADANDGNLKFVAEKTDEFGVWHTPPGEIGDGQWYHVAVTYDSFSLDEHPQLFINGQARTVGVQVGPRGGQTFLGGEAFLGENGQGTRPLDGTLDEVRIYNRVLDPAEVTVLALLNAPPSIGAALQLPERVVADRPIELRAVLTEAENFRPIRFSWIDGSNGVQLQGTAGPVTRARFSAAGLYTIALEIEADGVISRVPFSIEVGQAESAMRAVHRAQLPGGGTITLATRRADGMGILIAEGPGLSGAVSEAFSIAGDGTFSITTAGGHAVSGLIADNGATGSFEGTPFTALPVGGSDGRAGVYRGAVLGTAEGFASAVVGPDGSLALALRGTGPAAVQGSLGSEGQFDFTTAEGVRVAGQASPWGTLRGTLARDASTHSFLLLREDLRGSERLLNLSTRGMAASGDGALIMGFVLEGGPGELLLRGIGPALQGFGVAGTLADPTLRLFRGGDELATNTMWSSPDERVIASASQAVGAFPLPAGSRDAALLPRLEPNPYTASITGPANASGVVLAELYAAPQYTGPEARPVNLSTRGVVGSGDAVLIAGFVIEGEAPVRVLIRAVGPTLEGFGVAGALADPTLELVAGGGRLAFSQAWGAEGTAEAMAEVGRAVGAFALPQSSLDAALLLFLEPGTYTAIVRGAGGQTGTALVEVYEVP